MQYSLYSSNQSPGLIRLFDEAFSDSEGEEEGKVIASLVSDLITTTNEQDLAGFVAESDSGQLAGCIFFSRLIISNDKTAFILSPVAVATKQRGKGVGQQLIRFGLEHLKAQGVELVFTYGDPKFYSKVGFQPISEEVVKAPLKLTHPQGWLAQSLKGEAILPVEGAAQCVDALNKQEYW